MWIASPASSIPPATISGGPDVVLLALFACPAVTIAALVVVLAVWAARDASRQARGHRRRKGQCQRCGYDLAANVSGVCPECGLVREPR